MKSNFYEKIISFKDENDKIKINKMSQLLDESIDYFIKFRKRNFDEFNNNDLKLKLIHKYNEFESSRRNLSRNINEREEIPNSFLEFID